MVRRCCLRAAFGLALLAAGGCLDSGSERDDPWTWSGGWTGWGDGDDDGGADDWGDDGDESSGDDNWGDDDQGDDDRGDESGESSGDEHGDDWGDDGRGDDSRGDDGRGDGSRGDDGRGDGDDGWGDDDDCGDEGEGDEKGDSGDDASDGDESDDSEGDAGNDDSGGDGDGGDRLCEPTWDVIPLGTQIANRGIDILDELHDGNDAVFDGGFDGGELDRPKPPPPRRQCCWDRLWDERQLPAVIFDTTWGRSDDATGSCSEGHAARDFQLGFVAPYSGSFVFDTSGSSFDTVLYVTTSVCDGVELACNDDFLALESRVTVDLEAGEIVTVFVDGLGVLDSGPFMLTIDEAPELLCEPTPLLGELPQVVIGDTSNSDDQLASGCGGAGAPENIYEFVAPDAGVYKFDTFGSAFDTTLYLLESCAGAPIVCNDDKNLELQSEVAIGLDAGETVLVVVDGFDVDAFGAYLLNVIKL